MKKFIAFLLVALLVIPATFLLASATAETIAVDGEVTDNGWKADGWTEVTADKGVYQVDPTTTETISYKYQIRIDDTKVYFALVFGETFVPTEAAEANGNATNVRFWIHNGTASALTYTHFYDIFMTKDGKTVVNGFENTNPTGNVKAAIESSTIKGESKLVDGKWTAEFSIDLAEFGGANGFQYFIACSNKQTENICLFYPAIPIDETVRLANFPYKDWDEADAGKVDSSLKLGDVADESSEEPVSEDTSYEDDIKAEVGENAEDASFDVIVDAPDTYKAGEKVSITVTLKNITAEKGLAIVNFSFKFDDTVLTNANEINGDKSLNCVTTTPGGEASKWENLTKSEFTGNTIEVSVGLADDLTQVAKEDGSIVFTFVFDVKADATGKIGAWVPTESVNGQDADFGSYTGNGSYDIMTLEAAVITSDETSSTAPVSDTTSVPKTGDDGISIIVFAVIALVAVVGTAVVIKARR